jgi:outer membrane protein assembly factor BamB
MPGRSAANDGQIPGAVPDADSYQRLWQRAIPNMGFAALYGDALYYLSFEDGGPNRVVALAAATGEERWSRPLAGESSFSLLPSGVVVATAESAGGPNAFRVALLEHLTGQPIWTSADTFAGGSESRPPVLDLVLAGNTILFVDGDSAVVALDPATGQQRWRYEADRGSVRGCDQCAATTLVASASMVYVTDIPGDRLTALSLADGAMQWDATLGSIRGNRQTSSPSRGDMPMQLTAVDQGVIVSDQAGYFGLLSAADGSMVWSWPPDRAIYSVVRVQSSVYVAMVNGAPDQGNARFGWAEVEIATGTILRGGDNPNRFGNMAYLPDANRLIGGYRTWSGPSWWETNVPVIGKLFGSSDTSDDSIAMDPATLDVTWESSISRCIINLPVSPDGTVLCNPAGGDYGEIAVYAPKP